MGTDLDIRGALENPETSATLLHTIARRRYGENWYSWDPVTVSMELQEDYQADIPADNIDKLCAVQVLITTGSFFQDLDAFLAICGTFAEGDPLFDVFDPASIEEICWGVTEAAINREMLPFSESIKLHVRTLLEQDGYSESDYPVAIRELMESTPDQEDVLSGLASTSNAVNTTAYIHDQLRDMIAQFNAIPSLSGLDSEILTHGFMDAVVRGHR